MNIPRDITDEDWVNIGSGNALGAVRQQAITWVNIVPGQCQHMASLGHNDLTLKSILWANILAKPSKAEYTETLR